MLGLKRRLRVVLVWLPAISLLLGGAGLQPAPVERPAYAASPVYALYGSAPDSPDSQLQAIIEDVAKDLPGSWGVAVKKLDTGQYATYEGDTQQVSASLYKLWVLAELFRQAKAGTINLDGYTTVTDSGGAGFHRGGNGVE